MSQVPYTPLSEGHSTSRSSIMTTDTIDTSRLAINDSADHFCRPCKNKISRKQPTDHTPMECICQRCEVLETEVMKLKDHDMKSRLQIKELETKLLSLEEAIQGLTAPKQTQAAPFNFSSGQKVRNPFKKAMSVDTTIHEPEINFDNILQSRRSSSREHIGLFGSLGASSQYR